VKIDPARDTLIRWAQPDAAHVPLLQQACIDAVLLESRDEVFEQACARAGIKTALPGDLRFLSLEEIHHAGPGGEVVLQAGLWPGISAGPNVVGRGDETASASRQPWLDANGYLVYYLRALFPNRPPVLAYMPDQKAGLGPERVVPFDSLELALIEARVAGGNYILALEPRFREALLGGDAKALAAWRQLGRTAAWLRENARLLGWPILPTITALVEAGEGTPEMANLLFRQNVSPALVDAANPPPPEPDRRLAVVAVGVRPPKPDVRARILTHAQAGASVIVDAPGEAAWWRHAGLKLLKREQDRDFYQLGRGQLVAYHEEIVDISEFAFDVIDIITHKRRPVRVWNVMTVVPLATAGAGAAPAGEAAVLHAVNYGSPVTWDIMVRVQGIYKKATLLRPEASPVPLQTAKRGYTTEVMIPELARLGTVVFG